MTKAPENVTEPIQAGDAVSAQWTRVADAMPPQMHGCVRTAYWVVAQDVDRPERRRVLVAVLVDRDANRWKRLSTDDWSILERVTHYKRYIIPELPECDE
jgi:hypothetical protein